MEEGYASFSRKLVARGRTADVFEWPAGRVLKLFHSRFPLEAIRHEVAATQAARAAGLPVPAVHDIVQIEGQWGIVFEYVPCTSMLDRLLARPWSFYLYDRILPALHQAIHAKPIVGLPPLRQRLRQMILSGNSLKANAKDVILALLDRLPDGDRLCHGDFHPGNILLSPSGPMVIDWHDACLGPALADVATTCVLLNSGDPPGSHSPVLGIGRRWFGWYYLMLYAGRVSAGSHEFRDWQVVVAAAFLNAGKPLCRPRLTRFLDRVARERLPELRTCSES